MRRARASIGALALATSLLAVSPARAHEFRPAILDIDDLGAGRYAVTWRLASGGVESVSAPGDVTLDFPGSCRREPASPSRAGEPERFVLDCAPAGLAGQSIAVRGLGGAHGDALVRFTAPSGTVTAVLRADAPTFDVPLGPSRGPALSRARGYFGAGVEHILRGPNHLLFVLCLLLLVEGRAALARAVTAFTLAHSVTLALAYTGAVRLPPAPVEAAIALSLVLLAAEVARGPDGPPTLARRKPYVAAFAFGLLHGFGFAGGLAALRVPATDVPVALAAFNLGVEAGQLAFVAAALVLWGASARWLARSRGRLAIVAAYGIGSVAVFWCLDRVARFWAT